MHRHITLCGINKYSFMLSDIVLHVSLLIPISNKSDINCLLSNRVYFAYENNGWECLFNMTLIQMIVLWELNSQLLFTESFCMEVTSSTVFMEVTSSFKWSDNRVSVITFVGACLLNKFSFYWNVWRVCLLCLSDNVCY